MRLAIFDVDGTLVDTNRVDGRCFVASFGDAFGIERIDDDWSRYEHCTDSWITRHLLATHLGREPAPAEVDRARSAFLRRLHQALEDDPGGFREVPGAREAWARLRSPRSGWSVALGSGGWRASARLKLEAAGLDVEGTPGAFADDALTRSEIVAAARARAEERIGGPAVGVVYVGDAVWDVRTCAAAGLPFVGIARGARAERLRAAGATTVLPDLADPRALEAALRGAVAPRP